MKINTNKGFSLIELSIVLIIIGLLVAGITGGASLIKSAELRSTITEVRNYQTAVNAYYTAVGRLPGTDNSSQMWFVNSPYAINEMVSQNILDVKSISDASSYSDSAAVVSLSTTNSLRSKYKGAYYAFGYNTTMNQNVIMMFVPAATATDLAAPTTASLTAALTIKDAQFIDDKMDNGINDSGKIYAFGSSTGTCTYTDSTTDTARNCVLAIGIGL